MKITANLVPNYYTLASFFILIVFLSREYYLEQTSDHTKNKKDTKNKKPLNYYICVLRNMSP